MTKRDILLGQISAYIILAEKLDSQFYWKRMRDTLQLLHRNLYE